jgi:hypothetical protein
MTPNPKSVASGDTLEDIIKLFLDQGITSSPVKNPLGETLGVFTEVSLLKSFMLHKTKLGKSGLAKNKCYCLPTTGKDYIGESRKKNLNGFFDSLGM